MTQEIKNETSKTNAVEDRRKRAPGAIPKNVQSGLLLGIALIIVLVVSFSGRGKKAEAATTSASTQPAVEGLTPEQITANLDHEKKLEELNAQAAPDYLPGPKPPAAITASPDPYGDSEAPSADDSTQEEHKRAYESLFASNIALSYRPQEQASAFPAGPSDYAPSPFDAELLNDAAPVQSAGLPAIPGGILNSLQDQVTAPSAAASMGPHSGPGPAAAPSSNRDSFQVAGNNDTLSEGTVLETVLVNRLVGDFSGPVVCMVSSPLYTRDRQQVLVPAGSKVIGEAHQVTAFGQQRLAVVFHRLIRPDGSSISLDAAPGLDQVGETALHDQVNNHYFKMFGASMAIGSIAGLAGFESRLTPYGTPATARDVYQQNVSANLTKSSVQVLSKFLNLLPTITIREGHRVKVYLTRGLALPPYGADSNAGGR